MPVIELPEEPPLPGANTFFFPIFAVMLYPRSEDDRTTWNAAAMAGAYSWWRQEGAPAEVLSNFHGWLGVLWDSRQSPRRIFEDGMARTGRASLSGHLLLYLLRMARHHPQHCKVERAKALVTEFAPRKGKKVSESLVEKVWADFKNVSHLWAAMVNLNAKDEVPGTSNSEWLPFLGAAETLRRAGEEAHLLLPAETWRAPDGKGVPTVEVSINPLSVIQLAFLNEQFPGA